MLDVSFVTIVIAFSLGVLAGWLTGQTGPEPTVTAAVLPAVLTLAGTLIFSKSLAAVDGPHGVQMLLFIVVFCASFYTALGNGVKKRNEDLTASARETDAQHLRHLNKCFETELVVNAYRKHNGLSELPSEYFCRKAP